jgi:hypothetical protein
MVHGRTMFGIGRLGATLAFVVMSALTACAGKSERNNEDGDSGDNGDDSDDGGGSGARGGTGTTGKGGAGKGGTSNVSVTRINQASVDKADLLFMVDNSISMADKQRILAEAVPVLLKRLVDPICVDDQGNRSGDDSSADGCATGVGEFPPIRSIHIGVITSSLGNHGGDVCVGDPSDNPPRTLNDQAQLIASVRTGVYSYANQGFLVWDPRAGEELPVPDPHPQKGVNETNVDAFITDFTAHVTAAGERGCGYEASLEAWYRFLIDPEPINTVGVDMGIGLSVRGPVNPLVLTQRSLFMRPDSLLAIVMLTDENDCSIIDENGAQGWLVGRLAPMVRSSSSCADPSDQCCRPCLLPPTDGCPGNEADPECAKGDYLMPIEDSTNLRCFQQMRRWGVDLLYPWERYAEALRSPRISLRDVNEFGQTEVSNPIYTPGVDGTPARDAGLVFLVGIVGVPWQDIATEDSLQGAGLTYLTASELASPPSGPNRWDVILGDPDQGIQPLDPFMIETVDPRTGANPITGDMLLPPDPGNLGNDINGHEQNVVNRDDLQYACTFDLVPDTPCSPANQDGCDCNASEQSYNRSLCQYSGSGEGIQTHAKAYPGVRHLQVLKGLGDNAVVASICPKNVMSSNPLGDPSYGYNPAVSAMVRRFKEALVPGCLPRPFTPESSGQIPCTLVETQHSGGAGCSCSSPGRSNLGSETLTGAIQDELIASNLCGGNTGVECSDYCMCEIEQFSGAELDACQNVPTDAGNQFGFCYVDESTGDAALLAACPATERQIIRFMGPDVPAPRSLAIVACTGSR